MPKIDRRRGTLLASGVLALALATSALVPLPHHAEAQPTAAPSGGTAVALPRPPGPDFADLAARVTPAVVRVSIVGHIQTGAVAIPPELRGTPFEQFFRGMERGMTRKIAGQGSGFIIDKAGYIVTNNHVVGNADEVKVELADGRDLPAKVVGTDPQTDLALLKVNAGSDLPTVTFGDSNKLRVGEWVLAMGNPFGLGGTATEGIVSALGRQIGAGPYDDFIQTDAAINPGNSGGPLFNVAGEVIGVNSAIYSPSGGNVGIGFAVPSHLVQNVVEQLKAHGRVERGWLGVSLQRMDEELAKAVQAPNDKGALIGEVQPNSPAAKAGLKVGDVVVGFNGREISSPRDLATAVAEVKPGHEAKITVLRDGKQIEEQVKVGQPPRRQMAANDRSESAEHQQASLGIALAPNNGRGAVVARVRPDSVAAERGLEEGDVILRAGDREVNRPRDVVEAVNSARDAGRSVIALQIERDGNRAIVALPLKSG